MRAAELAPGRQRRDRSRRGGRASPRLRHASGRDSPVSAGQRARRSAVDAREPAPRGSRRLRPARGSPDAIRSRGGRDARARRAIRSPRTRRICAARCSRRSRVAREYNLAHMQGNVRLFEIGSAFSPAAARCPRETVARRVARHGRPAAAALHRSSAAGRSTRGTRRRIAELTAARRVSRRSRSRSPRGPETNVLWDVLVGDERDVGSVRRVALDAPVWASPAFGIELVARSMSQQPPARRPGEPCVHGQTAAPATPADSRIGRCPRCRPRSSISRCSCLRARRRRRSSR